MKGFFHRKKHELKRDKDSSNVQVTHDTLTEVQLEQVKLFEGCCRRSAARMASFIENYETMMMAMEAIVTDWIDTSTQIDTFHQVIGSTYHYYY